MPQQNLRYPPPYVSAFELPLKLAQKSKNLDSFCGNSLRTHCYIKYSRATLLQYRKAKFAILHRNYIESNEIGYFQVQFCLKVFNLYRMNIHILRKAILPATQNRYCRSPFILYRMSTFKQNWPQTRIRILLQY